MMDIFLEEYSSQEAVQRYTKKTAGSGISYLLEKDYGEIYIQVIKDHFSTVVDQAGLRLLEYGCGGGMNLIHLVAMLAKQGISVEAAYGTDFSEKLIEAARQEKQLYLGSELHPKVSFYIASNESLIKDMIHEMKVEPSTITSTFHLILGVNTIRYCHRLKNEDECAKNIFSLLAKGGICIIIDMNKKYPFFRSKIRDCLTKKKEEYYLPSLDEYARPFSDAGFEILRKENFCWIPHSASGVLLKICKALTPYLNKLAPNYAMRSLVIAKKP